MDTIQTTKTNWVSTVTIRHIRKSDLPALEWDGEYSHFRQIYIDAYNRSVRGMSVLWVADLPGAGIIGQVFIQFSCDRPELADGRFRAYLYSFRIKPAYRGAGLGTRILEVVELDLLKRGFHTLTLNVARDNPRAQQLYERLGYKVVAPEPGIWSYIDPNGVWHQVEEPAWRMEKRLGQTPGR